MRRTYRCAATIHPVRYFSRRLSHSDLRAFIPVSQKRRFLSNRAGLPRNPAPSRTDGLFEKPSYCLDSGFHRSDDSLQSVTLQRRGAGCKLCCGLGVRAVRAGSIGREAHSPGERTELPPKEAGGLGPRPIHEETSASWFQSRHGGTGPPGPWRPFAFTPNLRPERVTPRHGRVTTKPSILLLFGFYFVILRRL